MMDEIKSKDLNIDETPPKKKMKLDLEKTKNIGLSEFLTTPHAKTHKLSVQVLKIQCVNYIYKNALDVCFGEFLSRL